jgi:hypothetical protein
MQSISAFKIAGIAFFLAGFALLYWLTLTLRRAYQSRYWANVRGEIVSSKVTRYTNSRQWDWSVQYHYSVDGRQYQGARVDFGNRQTIAFAREIVAKFPAKKNVDVYYDSDNPGLSVLIPGPNRYSYSSMLIAPMCWAVALIFWMIK